MTGMASTLLCDSMPTSWRRKLVGAVFLNLSCAFDTINHTNLLNHVKTYMVYREISLSGWLPEVWHATQLHVLKLHAISNGWSVGLKLMMLMAYTNLFTTVPMQSLAIKIQDCRISKKVWLWIIVCFWENVWIMIKIMWELSWLYSTNCLAENFKKALKDHFSQLSFFFFYKILVTSWFLIYTRIPMQNA